jgi:hypothetical protein
MHDLVPIQTDELILATDELDSLREEIRLLQRREAELRPILLADPTARTGKRFVVSVETVRQKRIDADRCMRKWHDRAEDARDGTQLA